MKPTSNLRKLRPIWIGLAITIVFIITFSFQPVRAFASELLSLFRVQQISTVEIDISSLDQFTRTSTFTDTLGQVFADAVTITREKEEPQTGLDIETAKNAAGFALRFPKDQAPLDITLDTGIAFEIQMDASQIEEILASAGKEDLVLPESLKDSKIIVDIPASVTALYGNCTKSLNRGAEDCRLLVQIPSPTVQTSSGFDPVQLAEFGLQFLGMDPAEASSLSQSIDWKTTLVIPIPQGEAVNQDVAVDGVQGVLVKSADQEYGGNEYTLIWLKNDLIYAIFGYGDPAPALELADTLE